MKQRSLLVFVLLLLLPLAVLAQDDGAEEGDIAYLRLNSNFSVPEIPGWDLTVENDTILFNRDDISAQIYVRIVDTLDTSEAITTAIEDIEAVNIDTATALYEGRIGRSNGTWNYRIFSDGDFSVTGYALLQSNQVYVVLFAEESTEYDAYHLALRSSNSTPVTLEEINTVINEQALATINNLIDADFEGEPVSTRKPAQDNERWIEAEYANGVTTASYFFDGIIYVTLVEGNGELAADLSNAFDSVFLGFVITPDNIEFLYLGLLFSGGTLLALLGSMFLRYQNIRKDRRVLAQLEAEDT